MSYSHIIKRAAYIIRDPAHWTQGSNARDKYKYTTTPESSTATCFCARGAIMKACAEQPYGQRPKPALVIDHIEVNHLHRKLWRFNDDTLTKHQDVVDLLDKASRP